jgi:hypothetical protein
VAHVDPGLTPDPFHFQLENVRVYVNIAVYTIFFYQCCQFFL